MLHQLTSILKGEMPPSTEATLTKILADAKIHHALDTNPGLVTTDTATLAASSWDPLSSNGDNTCAHGPDAIS